MPRIPIAGGHVSFGFARFLLRHESFGSFLTS
jgi:hypothetical protein